MIWQQDNYLINIRKATEDDELLLLEWVNRSDSLATKLVNKNTIFASGHKKWFRERLHDKKTHIWIVIKKNNIPIGQVRLQKKTENYFDVDIYILEEERGKGIAGKALNLAYDKVNLVPLRAIVKKTNIKSYNFFSKNVFFVLLVDNFKWIFIKEIKKL